jgi:hypothetical protein
MSCSIRDTCPRSWRNRKRLHCKTIYAALSAGQTRPMHILRASARHRLHAWLTVAVVSLVLPLGLWPASASAATTMSISDRASCEATHGIWRDIHSRCTLILPNNTVEFGTTLTLSNGVSVDLMNPFESLTIAGMLNIERGSNWPVVLAAPVINEGTINVNGPLAVERGLDNVGQINVNSTVNVAGALDNFGLIVVSCGASVTYAGAGELHGGAQPTQASCAPTATPTPLPRPSVPSTPTPIPTPAPLPRMDLAGARIAASGNSAIYLVDDDGTARHIPDPTTYNRLFRDWNGVQTVNTSIASGPG